jgi:hypothetical protein
VSGPSVSQLSALREIYSAILTRLQFYGFRDVTIDPDSLLPFINGTPYRHYGAALRGVAVVAYHIALLELSLRTDTFFPRLLVIDSPAVGDLNEDTHVALLQYLADLVQRYPVDESNADGRWQIILTTRRLVPDLQPYVRATISAPDRMLLRARREATATSRG